MNVCYLHHLNHFFSYGFFSEETIVFSVPFTISLKNVGIQIHCKGKSLNDDFMKIERSANTMTIEGLPIADVNHPRLPNYYFDEILRKIGDLNIPKDFLSKIFKLNILIRKNIMNESQLIENEVSSMLSRLMNYEMNLISSDN